jgi:hypothetical protein
VLRLQHHQAGLVGEGAAALAPASIHPIWRASGGVISYELYVTNHLYCEAVVFQITIHINRYQKKPKKQTLKSQEEIPPENYCSVVARYHQKVYVLDSWFITPAIASITCIAGLVGDSHD